jgi:hypothetical protein
MSDDERAGIEARLRSAGFTVEYHDSPGAPEGQRWVAMAEPEGRTDADDVARAAMGATPLAALVTLETLCLGIPGTDD